jgi:hypothetical protein
MTLGEAFAVVDARDAGRDGKRAYTLTNACSVCPPFQCPKDDPASKKLSVTERRAQKAMASAQANALANGAPSGGGSPIPRYGDALKGPRKGGALKLKGATGENLPAPPPDTRKALPSHEPSFDVLGGRVPLGALSLEQEHFAKAGRQRSMDKLKSMLSGGAWRKENKG